MPPLTQLVKKLILNYPSLYKTRADVLKDIFTCNGNRDEYIFTNKAEDLQERTKCKRRYADDPELAEYITSSVDYKREQHTFDFIDKHIDDIAQDVDHSFNSTDHSNFYPDHYINNPCDISLFFKLTEYEEIPMEWREAAIEFGNVWRHYFFVKNSMFHFDEIKCNYDEKSPVGVYIIEDNAREFSVNLLSDIKNYNLISAQLHKLHTPEMIEEKIKRNKRVSRIVDKVIAEEG